MAHWIIDDRGFGGTFYRCSECRESWWDILDHVDLDDHCPNCGSIMNEDDTVYMRNGKVAKINYNPNPLTFVRMELTELDVVDAQSPIHQLTEKYAAVATESMDNAIMNTIIDCAQRDGITHLCIIDKKFVMDAIKEKMERESIK